MVRLAAKTTGVATTAREDDTLQVTTLFAYGPAAKSAARDESAAQAKPAKAAAKRKTRRSSAK